MFRKKPIEEVVPELSYVKYAPFIYPSATVIVGGTVYSNFWFWGFTKSHAAYRAQKYVQKHTGYTIPIYKSIKHHNEMLRLRKEWDARHNK